jgi:NAD(P)-dependent dehydrogenase (short-subunit alcohol dehydrogenase family)
MDASGGAMGEFPASGVALVSGGSGGIGAAVCRRLAAAGVDVALTYPRNREAAVRTVAAVEATGRRASAHALDLRDEDAVRRVVAEVAASRGGIHTLVSAHGPFIHMGHISNTEPRRFRETMEADVFAAYNLIHAALPHLRESRGALVAVATPAIRRYAKKDILSAAPKAAIELVVRGVAAEEGRFGVRANTVGVGVITDGMYQALIDDGAFDQRFIDATLASVALRRLGTAEEIAEVIVFLASNAARYVTGQFINADGGFAL